MIGSEPSSLTQLQGRGQRETKSINSCSVFVSRSKVHGKSGDKNT